MIPTAEPVDRVAIVGSGYTGSRLAAVFLARGAQVRTFSRRIEPVARGAGVSTGWSRLDLDADIEPIESNRQLVYYLVPPSHDPADERLKRFLDALRGTPRRIVYLSTTGVYGDQRGAIVNEETPPNPDNERSARRLAAESMLRAWAQGRGWSWCVLRVPGIYGPGRIGLERLAERSPAIMPSESTPGNRIQVSDLVAACVSAGLSPRADGRIYNVTDGSADSHTEFLQRVARIAGLPEPPLVTRAEAERIFSARTWSFLAGSRRVDNRRMLAELGVSLQYADLDAGIRASLGDR